MTAKMRSRNRLEPTAHSWRAAIARLEGAYSENTLRSYRADFASFEAWCRTSRLRPLPASPQAVAGFITAVAPKFSPSTLRRRLGGIRKVHRLMRLPNPVEDEEVLRRAKNDPFGDGRLGYLTPKTIKLLKKWLKASNIKDGWLFRRTYGNRIGSCCLHPYTVTRIIKELAEAAGLENSLVRQLSGHSMRVGAAQDMMTSGIGILPVMQAGGWRSMNIVGRYVQEASVLQNGIAQLFEKNH